MPCDGIKRESREQVIQKAAAELKAGRARIVKKMGRIVLEGLSQVDRGGMADGCILAGVARTADLLTRTKIHEAGLKAEELIAAHGHSH